MNKQPLLLVIGLIVIVSFSVFIVSVIPRNTVDNTFREDKKTSKPLVQKNDTGLCGSMSETACFAKLSGCVTADSATDFLNSRGFEDMLSDWPERWTHKKTPPITTNFPNAEIYKNTQPKGGGDFSSFPFVTLKDRYCELSNENAKIVFSPIKSKEDALKYYIFLQEDLGSAWSQSKVLITKMADYDDSHIDGNTGSCGEDFKEKLHNRVTETKIIDGGYLLTLIGFNTIGKIEFFESKVQVMNDGTITEISENTLLDCGPGYVF